MDDMESIRTLAAEATTPLLRVEAVAELLALGRSTVYQMIGAGDMPGVRMGKSIRVPIDQLNEWIVQQSTTCRRRK